MSQRLPICLFLCLVLSGCAVQDEPVILEEPIMEEELAHEGTLGCETGDEDGIGGTGCEPVARGRPEM